MWSHSTLCDVDYSSRHAAGAVFLSVTVGRSCFLLWNRCCTTTPPHHHTASIFYLHTRSGYSVTSTLQDTSRSPPCMRSCGHSASSTVGIVLVWKSVVYVLTEQRCSFCISAATYLPPGLTEYNGPPRRYPTASSATFSGYGFDWGWDHLICLPHRYARP